MINLKIQENSINLILISIFFLGSFFFQSSLISFKFIYAFQIIVIFYFLIKYSEIKINKKIIFLNLAVLSLIFFNFDKSYVYLVLLCSLNAIFTLGKIKQIKFKYNFILLIIFTLIMIACFKTTTAKDDVEIEVFFIKEIINSYQIYQSCLTTQENDILNNPSMITGNCEFSFKLLRYRFFDLHSNLTAIFCLIISYILLKNTSKIFFIISFSIFGLFFLYLTLSKSGLIFFLTILFLTIFNFNSKILLLLFFAFNIFLGIISHNISSTISDFWGKETSLGIKAYQEEFCPKIKNIPVINFLNECYQDNQEKNLYVKKMLKLPQILIFNFMGYSTFYKLHSNGMVVESISNNLKYYLFPDPLNKLEIDKIIQKKDITSKFSPHGLFFMVFLKYGIILGAIFFINLYFFLSKTNEKKLFIAFILSSTFLALDIFLLFPFFLLSMLVKSGYK